MWESNYVFIVLHVDCFIKMNRKIEVPILVIRSTELTLNITKTETGTVLLKENNDSNTI